MSYTSIPAKLVGEILEGKFIDLAELLPENLECPTPQPTLIHHPENYTHPQEEEEERKNKTKKQ